MREFYLKISGSKSRKSNLRQKVFDKGDGVKKNDDIDGFGIRNTE